MHDKTLRTFPAAVLLAAGLMAAGALAHAEDAPAPAADAPALTGHVDLASKYILRGISSTYGPATPGLGNAGGDAPESDKAALQWGLDWTHPSGLFLGYWASTINYSYERLGDSYRDRSVSDFQHRKSVENDLYGGYNGKLGELGYTVGLTGYHYINGKYADAFETKLGLGYGPFSASAQTLLKDVVWGNRGDTYWTLGYSQPLPYDIAFTATLGWYTYHREGQFLGSSDTLANTPCAAGTSFIDNGCFAGGAPIASGLRHLTLGFTQPIGKTGLSWGLQGLIGGDNRFGVKQANRLVATLSYGF
jgi:uncharacterized protein (TIGR02001 family)